ncbi:two-partner secretion domain-containing protein [Nostoc sp.]|uniref:two-partner secretion domain-containing protein n=1 Tax=Nostoc sp. TaxID=1180 RepID=UPI002FF48627
MIAKSWLSRCWQWKIGGCVALVWALSVGVSERVLAQIVPDKTLGAEGSVVTPNVNIQGIPSDQINGGATRGANLFHSFQEFNVEEGKGAYFANPTGIENILTRITGSNPSNILGRLGVLGGANLFLLNPNGIVFGPNAQLKIEGSFLASTASSFTFPDGSEFSAINPQAPPLLTISVPLGLQYGSNPGSVQVQGSNLQVNPGKTLALVGGNVSMDGGQIKASSGRIELGGVAGGGTVGLVENGSELALSFPNEVVRGDISLTNDAFVVVSAGGDGNIAINAQNLRMAQGSELQAGASWLVSSNTNPRDIDINATGAINLTEGSFIENLVFPGATGKGGNINITAGSLAVTNGAQLRANTFGNGDAGNLNIIVRDRVSFEGMGSNAESVVESAAEGQAGQIKMTARSVSASGGATLIANTYGRGDAGNVTISATDAVSLKGSSTGIGSQVFKQAVGKGGSINITTGTLSASGGATLAANTLGQGDGGSINITTDTMSASGGATLAANTLGRGAAGNVTINATDTVSLEGSSTAISSQVFEQAVGKGGSINITTGTLSASGGATLVANTLGQGDAGNVTISATDAVSLEGSSTGIGSQVFEHAVGKGGSINITTGTLSASGGATLVANTLGQGDAGNVTISATDAVFLEGSSTGIGSQVLADGVGNGGNIKITTGSLAVTNGARLIASTYGQGNGGNVDIHARDMVSFDGVGSNEKSSGVFSSVEMGGVGEGGDISVTTNTLSVADGAVLDAQTQTNFKAGDITVNATQSLDINQAFLLAESNSAAPAGNITINTKSLTATNGTIATSSKESSGGAIKITASDIRLFGDSDIRTDVASGAGGGGNINLAANSIIAFGDSDILAYADRNDGGRGGNITLDTRAFFGENYSPASSRNDPPNTLDGNNRVDVNATGAVEGVITLPDTTFIQNSLTELPDNQINTDSLLANSCIVRRNQPTRGSFMVTGTGGLPQRPGDAQMSSFPTVDVKTLPSESTLSRPTQIVLGTKATQL